MYLYQDCSNATKIQYYLTSIPVGIQLTIDILVSKNESLSSSYVWVMKCIISFILLGHFSFLDDTIILSWPATLPMVKRNWSQTQLALNEGDKIQTVATNVIQENNFGLTGSFVFSICQDQTSTG